MDKRLITMFLATSTLGVGVHSPGLAQDIGSSAELSDNSIVVTARRSEEALQDVPISITVFDQETLTNNNIIQAKDIATYTPNVAANSRWGHDNTTFTIRGFTQEQRTTATVGTYFADVVALRGSGSIQGGGDGAGPGQLFDLENVQVLKGPQGTLFGRNSTGGAVLLVPTKPKRDFEGYVEGTIGNYDRKRIEAVVNVPVGDSFRFRIGVDHNETDGYIRNIGFRTRYGQDMASSDYWTLRVSAVADLSDNVENYTVGYYTDSKSSGAIQVLKVCTPGLVFGGFFPSGDWSCDQIGRESAAGGFWTGSNSDPNAGSAQEQWQIINRTTWEASDTFTITNIFSYGEIRANSSGDAFGSFWPQVPANLVAGPQDVVTFVDIQANPDSPYTVAQSSLVEELRFSGLAAQDRLDWQAGFYFEKNDPIGTIGTTNPLYTPCANVAALNCKPFSREPGSLSLGRAGYSRYRNSFQSVAAYAQATFDLTEQLAVTGGIRYTEDKSSSHLQLGNIFFGATPEDATYSCTNPTAPGYGTTHPASERFTQCAQFVKAKTSAPTWMLGLEYRPIDRVMLFAKWSRGYRQGAVNPAAPDTLQSYGKEKVDTYEVGARTSWRGQFPGSFNITGYYNDFRDQQLQLSVGCDANLPNYKGPCNTTTTIINAGKSKLYGFEADLTVSPFEGFRLQGAYSYLNSELSEVTIPDLPTDSIYNRLDPVVAGQSLPFAIPHQFTGTASYTLPLPDSLGSISISGTLVYQSSFRNVTDNNPDPDIDYGILPSRTFGNASISWKDLGGMPMDAVFFVTNITNEKMLAHANDNSVTRGFVTYHLEAPRMYGLRLKFRFGALAD